VVSYQHRRGTFRAGIMPAAAGNVPTQPGLSVPGGPSRGAKVLDDLVVVDCVAVVGRDGKLVKDGIAVGEDSLRVGSFCQWVEK
jgi:hypothetical protein